MNRAYYFVFLLFLILTLGFHPPRGGEKTAYRNYYVGTFYYGEGRFDAASRNFKQAYAAVPEEFNFALALALSLAETGERKEALQVLQQSAVFLSEDDPRRNQKIALRYFVEGMIHCRSEDYSKAVRQLQAGLELQKVLGQPKMLSIFNNTLGYVLLLNQGKGSHTRKDQPSHHHLHRRDLERSLAFFETALQQDGSNKAARYNYELLSDSLGVKATNYSLKAAAGLEDSKNYLNIPASVLSSIDFSAFDEVLFLLDISGSMVMEKVQCVNHDRFKVMKETAQYIFKNIDPGIALGIATIGGDCDTKPRLWIPIDSLSRKDFRYTLDFLAPDGTTPLLTTLVKTPELFSSDPETRKAIFLVSDGANVCNISGLDICDWADALRQEKITIHILTFLNADLDNTNAFAEYTCLADNTFGRLLYIDANRCSVKPFEFNLVESCQLTIPYMQRVNCWGPAVKDLWGVFEE